MPLFVLAAIAGVDPFVGDAFVRRQVLTPASFQPAGGAAYTVLLSEEPDQRLLRCEVREDDRRLALSSTEEVRTEAGGRFFCTDSILYVSASDGSDPRTNGHRYELMLRRGAPEPRGTALGVLLLTLAVASALSARIAAGSALAGLGLVAVVGTVAAGFIRSEPWGTVEELGARADAWSLESLAREFPEPPRSDDLTRRIDLEAIERLAPESTGARPEPGSAPPTIALAAAPCARVAGSSLALPAGCSLTGRLATPLPARAIGSVAIEVELSRAASLHLELIHEGPEESTGLTVGVPADAGAGPVVIRDPFAGRLAARDRLVTGVRIGNPEHGAIVEGRFGSVELRSPLDDFPGEIGVGPVELGGTLRPSFWQRAPGTARAELPRPGRLKGSVGLLGLGGDASARFEVRLRDAAPTDPPLAEGLLDTDTGWLDFAAELPDRSGEIELGVSELSGDALVAWSGLRVVPAERVPRRVVMLLIDTLRADALGAYGHASHRTPNLDGLAASGLRMERAVSQSYWTRSSVASLMTGQYAPATGVADPWDRLPDRYLTLAERFAEAGFHTVSVIANGNAGPAAGHAQGFDSVTVDLTHDTVAHLAHLPDLLDELGDEDVLLYVHLMEVHGPYGPAERPADFVEPPGNPVERTPHLDPDWIERPTDASRIAGYGIDLERLDTALGPLLDLMWERWGETGPGAPITAVLSDHGEWLGEAGQWGHHGKYLLTPELVHVPFIVHAPGRIEPGLVWPHPVENLIAGPLLLALALEEEGSAARRATGDPFPWPLTGPEGEPVSRLALSTAATESPLFTAFADGGVLVGRDHRLEQLLELPSVGRDPWGRLPGSRAELVAYRRARTAFAHVSERHFELTAAIREQAWQSVDDSRREIDAATLQQLRQLGYIE